MPGHKGITPAREDFCVLRSLFGKGLVRLSLQNVPAHPAAFGPEKRHFGIMAQGTGRKPFSELIEHLLGHPMQVRERLRSEFDPYQLDQLGVGMDDALDAMSDG